MKAVLISIRPRWCELIASGKKTIEVRKTRPKLDEPFKCYIYCSMGEYIGRTTRLRDSMFFGNGEHLSNGKVIGEFVCDRIYQYTTADGFKPDSDISDENMSGQSCLSLQELQRYEYSAEQKENCIYLLGLYGWHISELTIYDKPRELSEFATGSSTRVISEDGKFIWRGMKRPPQSWCYVEEAQHP